MKTASKKAGLVVSSVLAVLMLAFEVVALATGLDKMTQYDCAHVVMNIVVLLFVMVYAFFDYKTPHGNLLKALLLIEAIVLAASTSMDFIHGVSILPGAISMAAALMIAYIAGRLSKLEKNTFLLILVCCLLAAADIIYCVGLLQNAPAAAVIFPIGSVCCTFVTMLAISFAYTARFDEHRTAGQE